MGIDESGWNQNGIVNQDRRYESAAAGRAVPSHFKARNQDVKAAVALQLPFQIFEKLALEFSNLPAAQAGHVDVISSCFPFIEVPFALHVHQVQFVDYTVAF